jgi:hypothetical protein
VILLTRASREQGKIFKPNKEGAKGFGREEGSAKKKFKE